MLLNTHEGFIDRVLRRCGERPWRSFLILISLLLLAWTLLNTLGLRYETRADRAPAPQSIPYHNYAPGGTWWYEGGPQIAGDLPEHDDDLIDHELELMLVRTPSGELAGLAAGVTLRDLQWGLPWELFTSRTRRWFDVTNPAGDFGAAQIPWRTGWSADNEQVYWSSWDANSGTMRSAEFAWAALAASILVIELAAAMAVFALWIAFGVRQRRRLRCGWCLACGHDLGPAARNESAERHRCPECGTPAQMPPAAPTSTSAAARWLARPGRTFVVLTLILLAAWTLVSLCFPERRTYGPIEERLARVAMDFESSRYGEGVDRYRGGFMTSAVGYGRPVQVLFFWDSIDYQWARGEGAQLAPRRAGARWSAGHFHYEGYIQVSIPKAGPLGMRHINVYWPRLALLVLTAQMAAAAVVGAVIAAAAGARRWRGDRAKPQAATS